MQTHKANEISYTFRKMWRW